MVKSKVLTYERATRPLYIGSRTMDNGPPGSGIKREVLSRSGTLVAASWFPMTHTSRRLPVSRTSPGNATPSVLHFRYCSLPHVPRYCSYPLSDTSLFPLCISASDLPVLRFRAVSPLFFSPPLILSFPLHRCSLVLTLSRTFVSVFGLATDPYK